MKISRRAFLSGTLRSVLAFLLLRMGLGVEPADARASHSGKGGSPADLSDLSKAKVVSVRSPGAAKWNFKTYPYIDSIDEDKVRSMLISALKELTGADSEKEAWRIIFKTYKTGDKIAIKPNFNDLHDGNAGMITSPAVLNAVIEGLVSCLGVDVNDIFIYDLCRTIPDNIRGRIGRYVNFVEPYGSSFARKLEYRAFGFPLAKADPGAQIKMTRRVVNSSGKPLKCYIPAVLTSSQHIINIPLLKAHRFISNSGAMKNHYGTVRFSDGSLSPKHLHPPIVEDSIVDINAHLEIRAKTRLIVMDGLFGRIATFGPPVRWQSFGGGSPEMLLLSRDPVAIDSVARHYLKTEMDIHGKTMLSDSFLRIAAEKGLGVYEDPDRKGVFSKIEKTEILL